MTITFKQFLDEAVLQRWESEDVELEQAIKVLNQDYKRGIGAIANGAILFRGDRTMSSISFVDTTNSVRTSRDTNNLYQLMFDASKEMQHIPSRTNSLICTTSAAYALDYGTVNVVVPIDGSTVAYCKDHHDIFFTSIRTRLTNGSLSIEGLCYEIENILSDVGLKLDAAEGEFKFTSISEIDRYLTRKNPSEIIKGAESLNQGELMKVLSRCPDNKKFTAMSTALMTPDTLGVGTFRYGAGIDTPQAFTDKGVECWVSGKCAIIPGETFRSIVNTMVEMNMPVHENVIKSLKHL